ncbi:hypothetical protein WBG78_27155 [Chryseolinea sp. T2]|uniref:hypothetical protein n=1 Tax=Chryseolinea sp. T2 TaxID=3129255 RepID=UPI0030779E0B
MSTTQQHQKLIERYFEGALSLAEQEDLKQLLLEDKDAQKDFDNMKIAVEAIRAYGFREMLKKIKKDLYPEE